MKTKKIFAAALAGLCAVSTMGVSAFADDVKVETAGEKAYKINAAFQAPAIDVTVPSEIAAIINPYMIEVKLSDTVKYEAEGVASPKYKITNNSKEIGIKVNATYSADGLDGIAKTAAEATAATKKLAYVTLNSDDCTGDDALVMTTAEQTALLLTLDKEADGDIWIGGAVPESPEEKWTAKDKLSINVVLDLNPYNTDAAGPAGPGGFTAAVTSDKITVGGAATLGNLVANNTYAVAYDGGVGGNVTPTFAGYSVTGATCDAASGCTVRASDARFSCTADGTYDIVIELENDSDSSDTPTITFRVTATDC